MKIFDKLSAARDRTEQLCSDLKSLLKSEQPIYQAVLRTELELLNEALDHSQVPERFRIAVVGTFKTGKSSFVNKLAEERLAGVESNPETAAITSFRYAENPRVEVSFTTLDEWQRMEELYEENSDHPEAYRVAGLRKFKENIAKRQEKSVSADRNEPVNLEALMQEWLKPGGYTHVIEAQDWQKKDGKKAFRTAIRQFTSSGNPLHYLVQELTVYAPVPLLRDHIELIDTPGLNDTQLYRGQLTEELLSRVDAILFLTQSGHSFSQYDKEFIVRQLRKKRLKHLRLIVTKTDVTYNAALHDAREEDEPTPTFTEHRNKETTRLRSEIKQTLNELLVDTNLRDEEGYYYLEQLDDLKIHFTSSTWFDEGRIEDSGIPAVKEALDEVLSENYHVSQMLEQLTRTADASRQRLTVSFYERLSMLETEFDPKAVKTNMSGIEDKLVKHLNTFEDKIQHLTEAHDDEQAGLEELMESNISRMQLIAKDVLSSFEKNDAARHWKSRRHGNWGYLSILGEKVADRIFPVMETSLKRKIKPFEDFIELASRSLDGLQSEISKLEAESAIEGLPGIDFAGAKERFMSTYIEDMQRNAENEKDGIVKELDTFASGELRPKLIDAKIEVASVLGQGTTVRQSVAVEDFYDDISRSLSTALDSFLEKRLNAFGRLLSKSAKGLYPKLRAEVQNKLETRKQLIQEQLASQSNAARSESETHLTRGLAALENKVVIYDTPVSTIGV